MIKGIAVEELNKLLRERIEKVQESEAKPDPGPMKPSERSSNLYELAFRRGTVRQLAECIAIASGYNKPGPRSTEREIQDWKDYCKAIVIRQTRMLEKEYLSGRRKLPSRLSYLNN